MLQSSLIRSEWPIVETPRTSLSRRVARVVEQLRLMGLRLEAAQRYAAARGPLARSHARHQHRGHEHGAHQVPLQALKWHQQMRRLDTLMLAPQRSLVARLAWRITRGLARHFRRETPAASGPPRAAAT